MGGLQVLLKIPLFARASVRMLCFLPGKKSSNYRPSRNDTQGDKVRPMGIPGEQRSPYPDEVGARAGAFAAAIRDDDMEQAWVMLSKETRGMRFGVWATQQNIDMQIVYRAAYDVTHPMRAALLTDFRQTV